MSIFAPLSNLSSASMVSVERRTTIACFLGFASPSCEKPWRVSLPSGRDIVKWRRRWYAYGLADPVDSAELVYDTDSSLLAASCRESP